MGSNRPSEPVRRGWRGIAFWVVTVVLLLVVTSQARTAEQKSRTKGNPRSTDTSEARPDRDDEHSSDENGASNKTNVKSNSERARPVAAKTQKSSGSQSRDAASRNASDEPKRKDVIPAAHTADESHSRQKGGQSYSQEEQIEPDGEKPVAASPSADVPSGVSWAGGLTVLSVVPSILLMTTCFVRFSVILGLLRQGLGTQQLPPNSVLSALCLFLTCVVMRPIWHESYSDGIRPYVEPAEGESAPSLEVASTRTLRPLRRFMSDQIENAGNSDTVWMLLEAQERADGEQEAIRSLNAELTYDDVHFPTLAAAYLLSELKVAFVIGFQILLPFVVIDLVVSLLLTTMGMVMLPPTTVSFPFKILLFVLVDGWGLVVGKMLASVNGG